MNRVCERCSGPVARGIRHDCPVVSEATEAWVEAAMELDYLTQTMNEHELKAVLFVAQRLHKGRELYGPLSPDKKPDWLREAAEEAADMLVYLACHEMQQAA